MSSAERRADIGGVFVCLFVCDVRIVVVVFFMIELMFEVLMVRLVGILDKLVIRFGIQKEIVVSYK